MTDEINKRVYRLTGVMVVVSSILVMAGSIAGIVIGAQLGSSLAIIGGSLVGSLIAGYASILFCESFVIPKL